MKKKLVENIVPPPLKWVETINHKCKFFYIWKVVMLKKRGKLFLFSLSYVCNYSTNLFKWSVRMIQDFIKHILLRLLLDSSSCFFYFYRVLRCFCGFRVFKKLFKSTALSQARFTKLVSEIIKLVLCIFAGNSAVFGWCSSSCCWWEEDGDRHQQDDCQASSHQPTGLSHVQCLSTNSCSPLKQSLVDFSFYLLLYWHFLIIYFRYVLVPYEV